MEAHAAELPAEAALQFSKLGISTFTLLAQPAERIANRIGIGYVSLVQREVISEKRFDKI
jgi:hypothetical protein